MHVGRLTFSRVPQNWVILVHKLHIKFDCHLLYMLIRVGLRIKMLKYII